MTDRSAVPTATIAPCNDDCDPAGLDDGGCSGGCSGCSEPACDGDCAVTRLRVAGLCGGGGAVGGCHGCHGCPECTCDCPVVGDRPLAGECLACQLAAEHLRDLDACDPDPDPDCRFRW